MRPEVLISATADTDSMSSGTDYTMSSGDDVTNSGWNATSVEISVPVSGDGESEYDETFIVMLSELQTSGSDMISFLNDVDTATGTIINDDGTTISINSSCSKYRRG